MATWSAGRVCWPRGVRSTKQQPRPRHAAPPPASAAACCAAVVARQTGLCSAQCSAPCSAEQYHTERHAEQNLLLHGRRPLVTRRQGAVLQAVLCDVRAPPCHAAFNQFFHFL